MQDIARYLELPQSTVSRHLAILSQSGLVCQARHRTWHYYYINRDGLLEALQWLHDIMPPDEVAIRLRPKSFFGELPKNPEDGTGDLSK